MLNEYVLLHGEQDDPAIGNKLRLQLKVVEDLLIAEKLVVFEDIFLVIRVVDCPDLPSVIR